MAHHAQLKGVRRVRGAKGGSISKKRANAGQKLKQLPKEVLLGEQPLPKDF